MTAHLLIKVDGNLSPEEFQKILNDFNENHLETIPVNEVFLLRDSYGTLIGSIEITSEPDD